MFYVYGIEASGGRYPTHKKKCRRSLIAVTSELNIYLALARKESVSARQNAAKLAKDCD